MMIVPRKPWLLCTQNDRNDRMVSLKMIENTDTNALKEKEQR